MLAKTKRVKLKGAQLKKLNNDIFARDDCTCIIPGCGRYVSPDHKFHHEPCGQNKSDEIDKGVVLCDACHTERHFKNPAKIKRQIENYLSSIYKKHAGK